MIGHEYEFMNDINAFEEYDNWVGKLFENTLLIMLRHVLHINTTYSLSLGQRLICVEYKNC